MMYSDDWIDYLSTCYENLSEDEWGEMLDSISTYGEDDYER